MTLNFVPLQYIKDAKTSLSEKDSLTIYKDVTSGIFPTWIRYDSDNFPDVFGLAELYVNRHAAIIIDGNANFSPASIHVFRCTITETIEDELIQSPLEGLLYSNGAVMLVHRPKEIYTIFYVDETTAKAFSYPMPS